METRLILTGDGSHTLFVPSLKEHYHSTFGAIRESSHIFIGAGFYAVARNDKPMQIFEVGFGTGLNAMLTLLESSKSKVIVHYSAIESDPVERSIIGSLNYPALLHQDGSQFKDLHEAQWGTEVRITEHFFLQKIHGKIQEHDLPIENYDLIYFDAFGPDVQPELWTEQVFLKLYHAMKPGAILVTYSVKGTVKRALKSAGFTLEKLPGPPGKREITRATKSPLATRLSQLASRNSPLAARYSLLATRKSQIINAMIDRFNIRIYGLLIDEGKVLLTDEFRLGILMTKFPGGGLHFGEGPVDCLKREFMEELHTEINIISHYYTTENFFSTKLLPFESQLINIYYLVEAVKSYTFQTTEKKFDFPEMADGAQCFRWIGIKDLTEDELTFPIDKIVLKKIKEEPCWKV